MKKILSVLVAFVMIFALCACNDGADGPATPPEQPLDGPGSEVTEENLYEAFLAGSGEVYADTADFDLTDYNLEESSPYFESGKGYTLDEFLIVSTRNEKSVYEGCNLSGVSYTYIDCGGDGKQELALCVAFEDGYGNAPTYEYVIKAIDGKLQLRYRTETLYRSYESLRNHFGLIEYGGSSGYSSGESGQGYLDADCNYHFIYSEEYMYMLGAYFGDWTKVCEYALEAEEDLPEDCWLYLYSFEEYDWENEEAYKDSLMYSVEPEDDPVVQSVIEKAGVKTWTFEEMQEKIDARYAELGIAELAADLEYPEWLPLESPRIDELRRFGADPVYVSNVDEFVGAIQDGATVALQPGTYNLTEWLIKHIASGDVAFREYEMDNPAGVLYGGWEDEPAFIVNQVYDLKIVSADPAHPAEIVSEPRYEFVIGFESCSGLTVEDVIMGHTPEKGVCSGDVIGLTECYSATLTGCDLYGCGAYGIYASDSGFLEVTDCCIHDCCYGCVESWESSMYFENCSFVDCEEFTMFNVSNGTLSFYDCTFKNLKGDMLAMYGDSYAYFDPECIYDAAALDSLNSYYGEGTLTIE